MASVYDRERIERELAAMRAALGDSGFIVAYDEGRAHDANAAAEQALAGLRAV